MNNEQLTQALTRFGDEYITQVFTRYKLPPATIEQAAKSTAPTFHDVTNFFSREATLMFLRFHIAETFAFLGIYDTASRGQVRETAELILDHEVFGQLNLDEFLQFLKQFKRGDYGKIYQSQRPNPQEFLMCLRPFWHELVQYRIHLAEQEQQEKFSDHTGCISREEWLKIKQQYEQQA